MCEKNDLDKDFDYLTNAASACDCTGLIPANTAIEGAALQTIVHPRGSSGTADPLDQRGTVGWKATKVTKRLCEEYMVRVEHTCAGPFAKAKAN